jgi:hypothetical protein
MRWFTYSRMRPCLQKTERETGAGSGMWATRKSQRQLLLLFEADR